MNIIKAAALTCVVGVCCGWACVNAPLMPQYDSVMMGISRSKIDGLEKVDKLTIQYDRQFAIHEGELKTLSHDDVLAMFRSANMLASYTMFFRTKNNPRFLTAMEAAFSEMQRRGGLPAETASDMAGAYIAARRFADANRIITANTATDLPTLPDEIAKHNFVEGRPAVYSIDAASDLISLENVDAASGDVIVIVAGCHFARDAAQDIAATPSLRQAFGKARTLWVSPADRQFDPEQLKAWNKEFPDHPMRVAYSHAPWKGVDFSQVPNFYFYRNGKLIAQHAGWKKGAPPQPVLSALRRMQLLD